MALPQLSSSQSDDGELQALQALKAAHERAAKNTLDKKKALLKETERLSNEYKLKVEASMNKHQTFLKSSIKDHKVAEKQLLFEFENTRKEILQLIQGIEKSNHDFTQEIVITEQKISKQTAVIVQQHEEIHEQEGKAFDARERLLWEDEEEVEDEETS